MQIHKGLSKKKKTILCVCVCLYVYYYRMPSSSLFETIGPAVVSGDWRTLFVHVLLQLLLLLYPVRYLYTYIYINIIYNLTRTDEKNGRKTLKSYDGNMCCNVCVCAGNNLRNRGIPLHNILWLYVYIVANSHPRWAAVVRWRRLVSYFIAEGSAAAIRQNVRLFFIYLFIRFVGRRVHLILNMTLIVGIICTPQVYTNTTICIVIEFRDLHGVRLCRRRRRRRRRLWRQWT